MNSMHRKSSGWALAGAVATMIGCASGGTVPRPTAAAPAAAAPSGTETWPPPSTATAAAAALASPPAAVALPVPTDLPEDAFKGQIFVMRERLPDAFPSKRAFVDALRRTKTGVLPVHDGAPAGQGIWTLEYIAFFAEPLTADQVRVAFYDESAGHNRFVASDPQYTLEKGARIFAASLELAKPEFESFRRYRMTIDVGAAPIASATVWLVERLKGFRFGLGSFQAGGAGAAPDIEGRFLHDSVERELGAPAGSDPSAPIGFYVDGKVTRLETTFERGVPAVACEARAVVVLWPQNEPLAWTGGDARQTSATPDLESARRGCMETVGQTLAKNLETLFRQLAPAGD
jgi:hypothetical protein